MIAESDSGRSTIAKQVRERLVELWSYLSAKQTRLINYGRQYREGHRISTARVESTVDQLVDWRMEKKQHMRWTRRGAQMLLHARCALLNGELGNTRAEVSTFRNSDIVINRPAKRGRFAYFLFYITSIV